MQGTRIVLDWNAEGGLPSAVSVKDGILDISPDEIADGGS